MPPICIHLSVAKEAAGKLSSPIIDQSLGSYLIGATAPDVHIITGVPREDTHFFELEKEHPESGAIQIFKAHPSLAPGNRPDAATRPFVAGYLSHLVTDEIWIMNIYRPFFGKSSPLGGEPTANLLDRALQYQLDCQEREDRAKMKGIQGQVCNWEPMVGLSFIDIPSLREWRDLVCAAACREPNFALFPQFAKDFLLPRHKLDPELLEQFLSSLPTMLEWAIQYITRERLNAFREKAISQSVAVAKEYLGEYN